LKLDGVKVSAALANLPELTLAMGQVNAADPSKNGFAKKLADWAGSLLATDGRLPGKTKSIQSQIVANQKDQAKFNDRLSQIESRLRTQYSMLDTTMSKANALSQYVSQQITTWNKSTA
jgi:flagellar hook-associated protein 2